MSGFRVAEGQGCCRSDGLIGHRGAQWLSEASAEKRTAMVPEQPDKCRIVGTLSGCYPVTQGLSGWGQGTNR